MLLGRDAVGKLMAWADAFDRAGAESIRGHLDMNRLMNRLSGAAARVLLSGRVGTLTKQVTTVINAMYASDEINLAEWLGAVRRYHAGKLVKPVSEIEALPELDSRDKTRFSATLAAMGADEAGRRVSRLERWNREGMDLLERVDMKGNAISAAILYDAVYRKAKRETPDATEAELDAVAMAEVRRSLSRKGQPDDSVTEVPGRAAPHLDAGGHVVPGRRVHQYDRQCVFPGPQRTVGEGRADVGFSRDGACDPERLAEFHDRRREAPPEAGVVACPV